MTDVIRSWSFAAQSNDERLFSAIAAVLALFLKTTSTHLEFREYGNQLSRALLEENTFQLFERGLCANKTKAYVISPCLRLLTEIVAYDGGASAKLVWQRRDITFLRLETLLTLRKEESFDRKQSSRKPSVRDNALRYLLVNLKLQSSTAKAGVLTLAHGRVVRAVFEGLQDDPPILLIELLNVFRKHVVADVDLGRNIKRGVFRPESLARIAALYKFKEDVVSIEPATSVRQTAHSLLLAVCTSPESGLLETSKSSQVHEKDSNDHEPDGSVGLDDISDNGISSAAHVKYRKSLSDFLQGLRPYANYLEGQLVLAVFNFAPESIAEYFQRKKVFSFEPKLTATWVGFSRFLMAVVMLPLPSSVMQTTISESLEPSALASKLMESILPLPLSQKSMTRCLNQSIDLITFFTIRILILAFRKLEKAVALLTNRDKAYSLALTSSKAHSAAIIVDQFRKRCPEIRHVIAGFRRTPKEHVLQREAFSRLLLYYCTVIPQSALQEKFDISTALSDTFPDLGALSMNTTRALEFRNLLGIAQRSPNMQWWHKSGNHLIHILADSAVTKFVLESAALSPFSNLLQMYCNGQQMTKDPSLRALLQHLAEENHIISSDSASSIDVLSQTLQEPPASKELLSFLDDCILHSIRKSVLYHEKMISFEARGGSIADKPQTKNVNLLLIAVADQLPFLVRASAPNTIVTVTEWLVSWLDLSRQAGQDPDMLLIIRDDIMESIEDTSCRAALAKALQNTLVRVSNALKSLQGERRISTEALRTSEESGGLRSGLHLNLEPPKEDVNHKVLTRWARESIVDLVQEGTFGELTLCLSSQHVDIQKQALQALRKVGKSIKVCQPSTPNKAHNGEANVVQGSDWTEALQIYMLLGEVVETMEHLAPDIPFPGFAAVFAARAFFVLANPLHPLYTKIINFLHKGPRWKVDKIPSYWIDKILLQPPSEDDGYRAEMEWLLNFLFDGLRTLNVSEPWIFSILVV